MEPIDTDDQVRNTLSDVESINMEYLLKVNQRVVNFLAAGTQEDKQRFIDLLHARIDREREARKAVSQARRTLRRPDIYAYVERWGINSSLVRQHYELPLPMGTSSRKNKSRHGITIRKNKHSVSTAEGSSSHLNRTESSQWNNVGTTSNMIPSFPTVAVLMRITMILYLTVTRQPILQRIFSLIFPESEPGQLQKKYATAWKIIKDIIWEIVMSILQFISGWLISFRNLFICT